jgi:predicted TIM-barrel fold metal-dependent hydrolase
VGSMTRRQLLSGAVMASLSLAGSKFALSYEASVAPTRGNSAKTNDSDDDSSTFENISIPSIVDAHIHLWDLNALTYPWLTSKYDATSFLGPYRKICHNYLIPTLRADTVGLPLEGAVHINAAVGHPNSVDETRWVQMQSDRQGFRLGIVAGADLASTKLREELDGHSQFNGFRGVRMITFGRDRYAEPAVLEGLRVLQAAGLVCDVDVSFPQFGSIERAARMYPSLRLIVEHTGTPTSRSADYFKEWRVAMRSLAAADNVACKISGLGIYDHSWTYESIKPWVLSCIDVFGTARCMFSSNWPVDSLYSSYHTLYAAYASLTKPFSDEERARLFAGNAREWYRLPQRVWRAAGEGHTANYLSQRLTLRSQSGYGLAARPNNFVANTGLEHLR